MMRYPPMWRMCMTVLSHCSNHHWQRHHAATCLSTWAELPLRTRVLVSYSFILVEFILVYWFTIFLCGVVWTSWDLIAVTKAQYVLFLYIAMFFLQHCWNNEWMVKVFLCFRRPDRPRHPASAAACVHLRQSLAGGEAADTNSQGSWESVQASCHRTRGWRRGNISNINWALLWFYFVRVLNENPKLFMLRFIYKLYFTRN